MYTRFDTITEKRQLYKVEIIGDAYFVVGGCPLITNDDAVSVLHAGIPSFIDICQDRTWLRTMKNRVMGLYHALKILNEFLRFRMAAID